MLQTMLPCLDLGPNPLPFPISVCSTIQFASTKCSLQFTLAQYRATYVTGGAGAGAAPLLLSLVYIQTASAGAQRCPA